MSSQLALSDEHTLILCLPAKKDNDFIYHEKVTERKSLGAIGKAVMAKALPIGKPMSPNSKVGGLGGGGGAAFDFISLK